MAGHPPIDVDHQNIALLGAGGSALVVEGRILIGRGPEQRCWASFLAADGKPFVTGASGRSGERAVCYLDDIGMLPGIVGPVGDAGFVLHPDLSGARRDRVTARLAWHTVLGNRGVEQRKGARIIPRHRHVQIRLPNSQTIDGAIEDLSKFGARIATDVPITFELGTVLVVGKRYAEIVRFEPNAIAVRFRLPFTDETFNPDVMI